jgi:catechol 2,3-dioxygenase-like lactoylglutathione lyase family enzyme
MLCNYGLLHVNLNVSDLARSVQFYIEALGFAVIRKPPETVDLGAGPDPIAQVALTIPQTCTILALTHVPSFHVGPRGLNHPGLVRDSDADVTAMVRQVTASGGTIQQQGVREGAGVVEAFAYVRDPDGYALALSPQAALYAQFPAGSGRRGR